MTAMLKPTRNEAVPWWMVLIEGISLVILGILLLTSPGMTTLILVQFVGLYWFISGIFKIIGIFLDNDGWVWRLLGGLLGIWAGLTVLKHPLWSPLVIGGVYVIMLGVQGTIMGIIGLVQAFRGAGLGAAVLGVISLIFGLLFLFNIGSFALALPWVIGIMALIGGGVAIFTAFKMR